MKTSQVLDSGQESVFRKLNVNVNAPKSQTVEPKSEPLIRYPRRIKGYLITANYMISFCKQTYLQTIHFAGALFFHFTTQCKV